jgi:hypothetical protein
MIRFRSGNCISDGDDNRGNRNDREGSATDALEVHPLVVFYLQDSSVGWSLWGIV